MFEFYTLKFQNFEETLGDKIQILKCQGVKFNTPNFRR